MRGKALGYSLLELIIALSLALFLSVGMVGMFTQCKILYLTIQHLHTVQASAAAAFQWLSHDARMAGLVGCVRLMDVPSLSHGQFTMGTRLVVWHEGGSSTAEPLILPHLSHIKSHSDVLLIQALNPNTIPVRWAKGSHIVLAQRSTFSPDNKLLISNCQHAESLRWGKANLEYTYRAGSEIGSLDKIVYYVGDTGHKTSDGGKPIYVLYRRNLNKAVSNPIALIDHIENMSIRLGVNINGDIVYVLPQHAVGDVKVRSLKIKLSFSGKGLLQHEWTKIIALREP